MCSNELIKFFKLFYIITFAVYLLINQNLKNYMCLNVHIFHISVLNKRYLKSNLGLSIFSVYGQGSS